MYQNFSFDNLTQQHFSIAKYLHDSINLKILLEKTFDDYAQYGLLSLTGLCYFFKFPYKITERIFKVFSKGKSLLSKKDFIDGIELLYTLELDKSLKVLFEILDSKGEREITLNDTRLFFALIRSFNSKFNCPDHVLLQLFASNRSITYEVFMHFMLESYSGICYYWIEFLFYNFPIEIETLKVNLSDYFKCFDIKQKKQNNLNNSELSLHDSDVTENETPSDPSELDEGESNKPYTSEYKLSMTSQMVPEEYTIIVKLLDIQTDTFTDYQLKVIGNALFLYYQDTLHRIIHTNGKFFQIGKKILLSYEYFFLAVILNMETQHEFYFTDELQATKLLARLNTLTGIRNLEDTYQLYQVIQHGQYTKVIRARNKSTGKNVAIKQLNKQRLKYKSNSDTAPFYIREVDICKLLKLNQHQNIVKIFDVYEDAKFISIVMEYLPVDLNQHLDDEGKLNRLNEGVYKSLFGQLIDAVKFLKKLGIVHKDIKPDNIMYCKSSERVKVVDFGLSEILFEGENSKAGGGTFFYTAPEVMLNSSSSHNVDVWSLGVTMYNLISGSYPFDFNKSWKKYNWTTFYGNPQFNEDWKGVNMELIDLIKICVEYSKHTRPNIEEIAESSWLRD